MARSTGLGMKIKRFLPRIALDAPPARWASAGPYPERFLDGQGFHYCPKPGEGYTVQQGPRKVER